MNYYFLDFKTFNKLNFIIWLTIVSSIIILSIVVFILNYFEIDKVFDGQLFIEKILFIIAIAIALTIIIFKRSIFLPANIVKNVRDDAESRRVEILLAKIRRNYIIVWSLGELIAIIGLIDYIFFVHLNSYLVYFVVSIYSVLINIPKLEKVEKCFELLNLDQ